ncbi:zinc finger BED domain-containing protein RICESLEEPER 1-like, partial [Gastrolobium bilobum]|uniref:zinc finger BED domain-containing protein RICESLEEPER 1-like n=1 Tax=Gastrolobium bilobum TaxID=150636 RepID=UPI002AB172C3
MASSSNQDGSNDVENEPVPQGEESEDPSLVKKRRKTSAVWNDFHEVDIPNVGRKAVCNYCKQKFATGGVRGSTSHLRRHSQNCLTKKLDQSGKKQTTLTFQPIGSTLNPFLAPRGMYTNEKMREIIATAIMSHEYPFSIVEDDVWMWAFKFVNADFEKVSRITVRRDCIALYEAEKKSLKALLGSVNKISITTDMWKSSHQIAEYMVITCHFIDSEWKLQKRVLSFVKVPLQAYNDVCIRNLKSTLARNTDLVLGGQLFHVRCCAHILNLLVQHGLSQIKGIIENVRESVKYVNHFDSRLKTFCDIVKKMGVKERKRVVDCPTRWNSTYEMLYVASKFKDVFPEYKKWELHYNYLPSTEDWEKVENVCHLLEVFTHATNVMSGTHYPTANLYLPEVFRVKQVINVAAEDNYDFMRGMARFMKDKFDKYWGKCNMLMAIASVLDPRCKFHMVKICFPLIYKSKYEAQINIDKVSEALETLYNEYSALSLQESSSDSQVGSSMNVFSSTSFTQVPRGSTFGFDQSMSMVREEEYIPTAKSELKSYLVKGVYEYHEKSHLSFDALEWWRSNSLKHKILSHMARDILGIPISTVASESTFSDGGRVIDAYRSSLAEDAIQALICGGDWLRNKYDLKKKQK